jgi:hypothetical protein
MLEPTPSTCETYRSGGGKSGRYFWVRRKGDARLLGSLKVSTALAQVRSWSWHVYVSVALTESRSGIVFRDERFLSLWGKPEDGILAGGLCSSGVP